MGIVDPLRTVVVADRHVQMQLAARAGDRDIQKPPLLVDALLAAGRHAGREVAVVDGEDVHAVPLESLGRMDRREHEVILVEVGCSGQVGARLWWVERQLAGEVHEIG